jgi:hypothetical protein
VDGLSLQFCIVFFANTQILLPSGDELSRQYKDMMDSTDYSYDGSREWPGIVRKVEREHPDFNL